MKKSKTEKLALMLICALGVGFLIIYLKPILAPLTLATLFALLLYPAVKKLEGLKVPRVLSILSLLVSTILIALSASFGLSLVFRRFVKNLPNLEAEFYNNLNSIQLFLQNTIGMEEATAINFINNLEIRNLVNSQFIGSIATFTGGALITTTLTVVFTFFLLYYRDKLNTFLKSMFAHKKHKQINTILDQMDDIAPRYLIGILTVVSILAVINSLGFYLLGVSSPVFMGLIAAILNIIPFVGTIFGFGVVFLFTIATQPISVAIGVLIMFIIVQFLDNNVLTPNITASKIKLNPLFAILAILIGNIIWGVLGMFIALPFLAMTKVVLDHTPLWQPLGQLLGSSSKSDKK